MTQDIPGSACEGQEADDEPATDDETFDETEFESATNRSVTLTDRQAWTRPRQRRSAEPADTGMSQSDTMPAHRIQRWASEDLPRWVRKKTDDRWERLAVLSAFGVTLQLWDQLQTHAEIVALLAAAGFIVLVALLGEFGGVVRDYPFKRIAESERRKRVAQIGPLARVPAKTRKSLQFGVGIAAAVIVALASEALGYDAPQTLELVQRLLRLLIGV